MISVKELMIGDLVNYRPGWIDEETNQVEYESGTGFPVRIEFLYYSHGECLVQYNDGENDGIEAAEYELFPIPLTAEILEKNGFKCRGAWCLPGEDLGLRQDGNSWGLLSYYAEYDALAFCHIKYAHELQHALRLCGIEHEITL